jgi:fatty-acyl-CoA synthase
MNDLISQGPTVGTQALRALARFPQRTAFTREGQSLSYRQVLDLVGRYQAVFAAHGLGRGDRMAILTAIRAEAWCASLAAQCSAISISWLHPLGSLDDQVFQIFDSESSVLLVDEQGFGARGEELAARTADKMRVVFALGPTAFAQDLQTLAAAATVSAPRDLATPDDIAVLNYTGGTTGRSKGALRTHARVAASTTAILSDFEFPAEPRYLLIAPMSHVAGTKILPTLARGGTVHLVRGFEPGAVLATIARERINFTLLVPTMIYMLLDHPQLDHTDLSSLELLLYGASPMSPARLQEGLRRIGPVFSQLYGQTECYPVSLLRKADHDPQRPELFSSCGAPISSVDVAILDDNNQPVAPGEPGEICVRAAHTLCEYWKQPELTAELFKGGWLHTGDIGRIDDRGYLFILDRKKDMIVSGGFNIYPRDIEDVLSTDPQVAMVSVIGVPDPKWGEAVMALVVPRAGARPDSDALAALVRERKGATHAPKRIEFVDALPLTAVGKVDKKALRARYWQGQDRQVG